MALQYKRPGDGIKQSEWKTLIDHIRSGKDSERNPGGAPLRHDARMAVNSSGLAIERGYVVWLRGAAVMRVRDGTWACSAYRPPQSGIDGVGDIGIALEAASDAATAMFPVAISGIWPVRVSEFNTVTEYRGYISAKDSFLATPCNFGNLRTITTWTDADTNKWALVKMGQIRADELMVAGRDPVSAVDQGFPCQVMVFE